MRNRRVSILQSNPLWGPRRNYAVPLGMIATALIAVVNLYGPGLQNVFGTTPIPGMFWGLPFSFALGILCMDETRKLIVRTYPKVSVCLSAIEVKTNLVIFLFSSLSSLKWHGNCRVHSVSRQKQLVVNYFIVCLACLETTFTCHFEHFISYIVNERHGSWPSP